MKRLIRGLTLLHPWAFAIAHLGKRVENRSWDPRRQGGELGMYLAIHGGVPPRRGDNKKWREFVGAWDWINHKILQAGHLDDQAVAKLTAVSTPAPEAPGEWTPDLAALTQPGIVAVAQLADVTTRSTSPWAIDGDHHWLLADVVVLPEPVLDTGNHQGLWKLQDEADARVRALYREARSA